MDSSLLNGIVVPDWEVTTTQYHEDERSPK